MPAPFSRPAPLCHPLSYLVISYRSLHQTPEPTSEEETQAHAREQRRPLFCRVVGLVLILMLSSGAALDAAIAKVPGIYIPVMATDPPPLGPRPQGT
jgi:hypothetical protein